VKAGECRVVCWVSTDVSEEHIASIFRVEKISWARNQGESRCRHLLSTSVDTQRTTRNYIPEDGTLYRVYVCAYFNMRLCVLRETLFLKRQMATWVYFICDDVAGSEYCLDQSHIKRHLYWCQVTILHAETLQNKLMSLRLSSMWHRGLYWTETNHSYIRPTALSSVDFH
jgi:hypothetical protein